MEIKVFSLGGTHFCNKEDLPREYICSNATNSKLTTIVLKNKFKDPQKEKILNLARKGKMKCG